MKDIDIVIEKGEGTKRIMKKDEAEIKRKEMKEVVLKEGSVCKVDKKVYIDLEKTIKKRKNKEDLKVLKKAENV